MLEEHVSEWVTAYEHRGEGSTLVRAWDVVTVYEVAAPIPDEMPGPDANEILFQILKKVPIQW